LVISTENYLHFAVKTYAHFLQYLVEFLESEMFQKRAAEKIKKTHFMFSNIFSKIVPLMRQCGKRGTSTQATDYNTTRRTYFVCWITQGYKHTLRIYNSYGFSTTTTMVSRKRLNVTFIGRPPDLFTFTLMTFLPWMTIIK